MASPPPVPPSASAWGDRAVAVGGANDGIISTGDQATNVLYTGPDPVVLPDAAFAPVDQVTAPAGLMNVPVLMRGFVGRSTALDALDTAFRAPPSTPATSSAEAVGVRAVLVQAVHGLGGIGKSALAAHWASTRASAHAPIWWINAETPEGLQAGLGALTVALQPGLADVPLEILVQRAVQWLGTHLGWLLILDNVTTPQDVEQVLARLNPGGKVLITSRRATGWHHLAADPVRLDVLDPSEALDMLQRILTPGQPAPLDGISGDVEGLEALCAEVGYLPLAIEQAGAYMAQAGISANEYLNMLAAYPAEMYRTGGEDTSSERTLARIWHATLDRLTDTPLCGDILRVLAWYAPQGIPRRLLAGLGETPEVSAAIGRLATYSMITLESTGGTLAVHRMVQALARTPESHDRRRDADAIATARAYATTAMNATVPNDWRNPGGWATWRTLLPHIDSLTTHIRPNTDPSDIVIDTSRLLNATGLFLNEQGAPTMATKYLDLALTCHRRVLGNKHPNTLSTQNNLAYALRAAGDLGRAIPLYEEAITSFQRALGKKHPVTMTVMNNLAYAYQSAGDLGRAIPLLERALTGRRRVQGGDHSDTLAAVNNLAYALHAAGDLTRAIPLYEQALAGCLRVLGEEHQYTLTAVNNLAVAYQLVGDLERAIPLLERARAACEQVLGEEHPDTLISMNNLASAYESAGDLGRAIPLYEQTLTDCRRVHGDEHPHTLISMNNLADAYQSAGDLGRAIPLHEQTLTHRRRVLGEEHPETLSSVNNLATAYESAGDLGRAIPLYQQALTGYQRVLGKDHPNTLTPMNNLADAYRAAGDLGRAIPLYQQALTNSRRVLGPHHPNTKIAETVLADARAVR